PAPEHHRHQGDQADQHGGGGGGRVDAPAEPDQARPPRVAGEGERAGDGGDDDQEEQAAAEHQTPSPALGVWAARSGRATSRRRAIRAWTSRRRRARSRQSAAAALADGGRASSWARAPSRSPSFTRRSARASTASAEPPVRSLVRRTVITEPRAANARARKL